MKVKALKFALTSGRKVIFELLHRFTANMKNAITFDTNAILVMLVSPQKLNLIANFCRFFGIDEFFPLYDLSFLICDAKLKIHVGLSSGIKKMLPHLSSACGQW